MIWQFKLLIAALILGIGAWVGYRVTRPVAALQVETSSVAKQKHTVKTVTKKPDGTTKSVTTTDEQVDLHGTTQAPDPYKPNWSVGANWKPSLEDPDYRPSSVEIGRRVTGDLWIQGGYDLRDKSVEVGVRAEF